MLSLHAPRGEVTAVSYGHADKLAAITTGTPAVGSEKPRPPIDPPLYRRDDVRRILGERDIGALYRVLRDDAGLTQRTIAELTGMAQSEVCEIIKGRQVMAYDVLVRIAEGLGIPRELMGLSWWGADGTCAIQDDTYAGEVTVAETPEGVSAEMLRRHLLALGATAAFGAPIKGLGQILDLPIPAPLSLPSRVFAVHVGRPGKLTGLNRR
jgi:transcriptional regulator with XRE-family HTH domain